MTITGTESTEQFLSGGGEMGHLIRSMDWSTTALGPISSWPQSLRTSVSLCLSSTFPILIAWGPETIQIYNDSYRPICGAKHPESMGQNFRICWETALPVVGDKFTRGQQGEGTYITDQRMFLDRYGYLEESFMTFSFAPIRDESGGVGGIFHPITESTEKMLSARRTQVLRELGAAIGKAKSVQEIGELTLSQYLDYQLDIPFVLLYQLSENEASLINSAGIDADSILAPQKIDITNTPWPLQELISSGEMVQLGDLKKNFGQFICGPYEDAPHTAILLPLRITGKPDLFGFMIAGVSVRRALDQAYLDFYDQLRGTYNSALSNVYAYEQEQKRAEALAQIDRSKTAFFSNVSHEFRTPLTLMLGPLEDLMQQENLDARSREQIEATQRNAFRLLKLVNNLLDFSRVEAGRVQAFYQPINLSELTVDLASSFRSIIEKAGMELIVQCVEPKDVFYADRQMWEKIVLNLLSNAFKYTLHGTISVNLCQEDNYAVLKVKDTGVGIPEKELPHMFERFHRIENSAGRTHEGSGIGLSLVHELVHLHGGEITVISTEGLGSIFTVKIPSGKAHLPEINVGETNKETDSSMVRGAFVKEANSLLQEENLALTNDSHSILIASPLNNSFDKETCILVVDDNADMREYLVRILSPYFTVKTAKNGHDALLKIKSEQPDLVLSDVMMPVMDGKIMLQHIRSDEKNLHMPVIFLSARAGEEARIDGLRAGADDYLVKPFSAGELLTKIRAQIKIAKARSHAEQQLRNLLANAPVAMAIYRGSQQVIELVNEQMLEYWGRIEQQVIGRPLLEAIPELEAQGFKQIMDNVYRTGKRFTTKEIPLLLRRFGKDETIYINLTIEALNDENKQINGLIAVAAEVTEQVTARKDIEKVNDTLKLAMDAATMGIWRTNLATGDLYISETARHIHGFTLNQELTFQFALENLVIPEHRERISKAINMAVVTNSRFNEDYQIQPLDSPNKKWLNTTGMVELSETGEVKSVIGTILDITEIKEDELRKNDFIGMVSHELKTPLTSLNGYTQLGLANARKKDDAFNASIYEKVTNQVRKMTVLINGFLNVSRLDSGKIQLNINSFRLDELIKEIITEVSLTSGGQQFTQEYTEITVKADHDKIGTVLTNLLSNAIKYGAKGKQVFVSCRIIGQQAQVCVRDEGMGIKSVDLNKLFDRFYRVESTQMQNISGFGIGLYLSAEIIKRHGGRIWAESEPGNGAAFYFELPL